MIPFFDITRQNRSIEKELKKEIKEVIKNGVFVLGPKVAQFEKAFARYLGVKYAVGVASGTDALSLSLLAVGAGEGDEVIVPANCYPTAFAVVSIRARPLLVDIDPLTFNINPGLVANAITRRTRAIIPVHMYGQPTDMSTILEIGRKFDIPIIEDCAQAGGAEVSNQWSVISGQLSKSGKDTSDGGRLKRSGSHDSSEVKKSGYKWEKVGSLGDIGCFSFYPTKNLACFGDGGMIVTNKKAVYDKLKLLRMYGEDKRYHSVMLATHSRLDEVQAAVLLVKLKYLDKWNEKRRRLAELYIKSFTSFSALEESSPSAQPPSEVSLTLPSELSYSKHIYHLFVIRAKKRDELKAYLEKKGIGTAIHYPDPVHLQPSFKYLDYKKGDFPESERVSREVLSLPMFPELKDREVEKVIETVRKFYIK